MAETLTLSAPPALLRKLDQTSQRYGELQDSLNDPAFVANPQKMIAAIKESPANRAESAAQRTREFAHFYGIENQRLASALGFTLERI